MATENQEEFALNRTAKPPQAVCDYFDNNGCTISPRRAGLFLLQGSASTEVYCIVKGQIQISRFAENGKQSILRNMGPGEIFGEMSAIDGAPRSASVSTQSGCTFQQLRADQFLELLNKHPDVGIWLARELVKRIRDLTDRAVELATMSVSSRLQSQLLRLCERDGISNDVAVIQPLPTHHELAAMIGTHREAVTRELGMLSREEIVSQANRKMTVRSVEKLSNMLAKTAGHHQ